MLGVISYPPIPLWDVGPFTFSLHGLFAALGFIAGAWIATVELRKRGFDIGKYQSALTWGLIGALLGARYLTAPAAILDGTPILEALHPLNGSFSILGGFVGGIGAGVWRMRQVGLFILPTLDMSAFGLALGTIVGRIGDLAIVEHLGRATDVWWGYGIKPGYDVAPLHNDLECDEATVGLDGFCGVYHHVGLYDLIGAVILLGALYFIYRRFSLHYGQLFFIWVAWYGLQRFVLDFLRFGTGDAEIGAFTWNQVVGLAAGVGGLVFVWYMGRRNPVVTPEEDKLWGADLDQAAATAETD
ncbi:MAG: prolipoprotein diacylglyceryl transferase [Actinobacteria bacterium]|nr:prolipoprotein diacylglyceryl transferase [Actinomycetota bacterium]